MFFVSILVCSYGAILNGVLTSNSVYVDASTGLNLGLHPANERRRYFVMSSLIGWVQAANQPCCMHVHSWDTFHKQSLSSYLKSCENSIPFNFFFNGTSRSQFCTWHNSSAVVPCAKFWSDWSIVLHVRTTLICVRFGLLSHKPFVKWVRDISDQA